MGVKVFKETTLKDVAKASGVSKELQSETSGLVIDRLSRRGVLLLSGEERLDISHRDEAQRNRDFTEVPLVARCLCAYDLVHLGLIHRAHSNHVVAYSLCHGIPFSGAQVAGV